jgi:type II secretory pathway component PulF
MPAFAYKARRRTGEVVQGTLEVPDRGAALAQIERMGLFPVAIDTGKATGGAAGAEKGQSRKFSMEMLPAPLRAALTKRRRPKLQELATYTTQLANLLTAGMPLTLALNSMSHLESPGIPSEVSKQLKQDVMEGKSLSDAMAKQTLVFNDLYINMVRAGEQSGALTEVLRRMASHFERFAEVQAKFKSAIIYPVFVLLVGIAIVIFFMTYMLPKFMSIFEGLNVTLPLPTRILMASSNIFKNYWWLMLLVVGLVVLLVSRFRATPHGRRSIDLWKLKLPIVGRIFRLNVFSQFASTLSTLLHNGVPVLTALKITEDVVSNIVIKEAIAKTRDAVTDGKTIAQPLASSKVFPQLMVDLVKIGEETGDVPGALSNIATTYEGELSLALRVVTNMIEPIIIIFMAVGVGFLLLSVLSAMFSITSSISR